MQLYRPHRGRALFLAIQEEGRKNTNMRFWIWTTDFRDLGPLVLLTKGLLGSVSVMSDITFVFQSSERIYWLLRAEWLQNMMQSVC